MAQPGSTGSGRDLGVRLAQRQILERVAVLAAQAPGHRLTVETVPGRGERFVARAITPAARPYLLITDDLDELYTELAAQGSTRSARCDCASPVTAKSPRSWFGALVRPRTCLRRHILHCSHTRQHRRPG